MKSNVKTIACTIIMIALLFCGNSAFSQRALQAEKGDSTVRDFQFSIFPFMGINSNPYDARVNVSINFFGGFVKEVKMVELGSILNIDRKDVGMCQLSGVGNIVGGSSKGLQGAGVFNAAKSQNGVQAAGVLNAVLKDAKECQLAGVANFVGGSSTGLQAAGVLNVCKSQKGAQLAGVLNAVIDSAGPCQAAGVANVAIGPVEGLQAAGVVNIAKKVKGAQISGVVNATTEITGAQISGVTNISWQTKGAQIAGVMNFSKDIDGAQVSGVLNLAWNCRGSQLSLVNIADSVTGIPVGFFSFVAKGYHKIEFSTDEIFYANAAFKTGVPLFHNIFSASIRPGNYSNPLWAFGYGVGTTFGKPDKLQYDLELSAQHVNKGSFTDYESDLYKIYFGVDRRIASGISIAAGVSYNFYLSDKDSPDYSDLSKIMPYRLTNDNYSHGLNSKTWLGARVAVRFL